MQLREITCKLLRRDIIHSATRRTEQLVLLEPGAYMYLRYLRYMYPTDDSTVCRWHSGGRRTLPRAAKNAHNHNTGQS